MPGIEQKPVVKSLHKLVLCGGEGTQLLFFREDTEGRVFEKDSIYDLFSDLKGSVTSVSHQGGELIVNVKARVSYVFTEQNRMKMITRLRDQGSWIFVHSGSIIFNRNGSRLVYLR